MLCFSQPAFIGQHFSATLAVRQALSEQAGGSLCWQLPVSCFPWCFGSFSSLFIPSGAQTPAELLRLQQGCSSHKHAITFLSAERETEQMLRAGSCPGDEDIGARAVRPVLAPFDPSSGHFYVTNSVQHCVSLSQGQARLVG